MSDERMSFTRVSVAVGAVLLVPLLLVAILKFQRARIASNEAAVIADLRTVINAERSFAGANCGYFDDVVNLCRTGNECAGIGIPGYRGPDFLDSELARKSPHRIRGYWRRWEPVASRYPRTGDCQPTPTSVEDYCYLAEPTLPGWTGARYFAATGTGEIYQWERGPLPCPIPTVCVVEGALVATPSGAVPIESLRVGDEVIGADEKLGAVVSTRRNTVDAHLRLTFANKTILDVTDVHPISTPDGWKAAGILRPGDAVHARGGVTLVERVDVPSGEVVVYDLTVGPTATFYANGILVHNKSE